MENKKQEDLDTLYLLKSIKYVIIKSFESILWILNLSLRKWHTLSLFISVPAIAAFLITSMVKPSYKSQMSLSHIRLENEHCFEMIKNLNASISVASDQSELAHLLSMSVADAQLVKSINYLPLNENTAKRYIDSLHYLLPFKIEVEVYNNSVLDILQVKLLNYLENNPYALQKKKKDFDNLNSMLDKLERDIAKLDSLKTKIEIGVLPKTSGSYVFLGEQINPITVYDASNKLFNKKQEVQARMLFNNSFNVIVGFTKKEKTSIERLAILVTSVILGYLIGLIYLVQRENRLKVN